jgi:hypothetical protein
MAKIPASILFTLNYPNRHSDRCALIRSDRYYKLSFDGDTAELIKVPVRTVTQEFVRYSFTDKDYPRYVVVHENGQLRIIHGYTVDDEPITILGAHYTVPSAYAYLFDELLEREGLQPVPKSFPKDLLPRHFRK